MLKRVNSAIDIQGRLVRGEIPGTDGALAQTEAPVLETSLFRCAPFIPQNSDSSPVVRESTGSNNSGGSMSSRLGMAGDSAARARTEMPRPHGAR